MRFKLTLLLLVCATFAQAQQNNLPLNRNIYNWYEPALHQQGTLFHTAIKPYRIAEVESVVTYDSVFDLKRVSNERFFGKVWNWIGYDTIVGVSTEDFHLRIDPVINFGAGMDVAGNSNAVWINTRGISAMGDIGAERKVSFAATFRENQGDFPNYLVPWIRYYNVVPGQGKVRSFKGDKFDFANASGYVSYSPSKIFNFQLGHDRNFIGDGYRSMLMSDNAVFYPFFKISTTVWRIKYVNIYTEFTNASSLPPDTVIEVTGLPRKFGSFHYLSYDVCDWLQVGLFEGIIWPANDSTRYRGFDVNYLNPIIFFRPIEFGLGSPDNAMMGATIKVKPVNNAILYGQFLLDDLDVAAARGGDGYYRNKFGIQAGFKVFNPFKIEHLTIQGEMNQAAPYTYAHKEPEQNYVHYNQPMAHPLGANFREFIGIVNYRFFERFYVEAKLQKATIGYDNGPDEHFGSNLYISDFDIPNFPDSYGNFIGQGLKTNITSTDLRGGFLINPSINLNIEGQIFMRNFSNENETIKTTLFMLALKTDLFNHYYDL